MESLPCVPQERLREEEHTARQHIHSHRFAIASAVLLGLAFPVCVRGAEASPSPLLSTTSSEPEESPEPPQAFTEEVDGVRVEGVLDAEGNVISLSLLQRTIFLTHPLPREHLPRFIRSASRALRNIAARSDLTADVVVTAFGGARFFLTATAADHAQHVYCATPHDVLRLEGIFEKTDRTRRYRDDATGHAVTEVGTPGRPQEFTRNIYGDKTLLFCEKYEVDALRSRTEYVDGVYAGETRYRYFSHGVLHRETVGYHTEAKGKKKKEWRTQRQTEYWPSGSVCSVLNTKAKTLQCYTDDGQLIFERWPDAEGDVQRFMIDREGHRTGTYVVEKEKDPALTPEKYLDLLAERLHSPTHLAVFFENFLQYVADGTEYWQPATKTVRRLSEKTGKMKGDCDDWAFLARAILRRQGYIAHVIGIPKHAECVWVEGGEDGRYHASSLGTFGYDRNGNRFHGEPDPAKVQGYRKVTTALNSLMAKYKYPGLGLARGQNYTLSSKAITILKTPTNTKENVTASFFLKPL